MISSINTSIEKVRDFIENTFDIPTYTERLNEMNSSVNIDCLIHQDDADPWRIDKKVTQANIRVILRYRMDILNSGSELYVESNAADHALSIIHKLLSDNINGINLSFELTKMGYDDQQIYWIDSKLTAH